MKSDTKLWLVLMCDVFLKCVCELLVFDTFPTSVCGCVTRMKREKQASFIDEECSGGMKGHSKNEASHFEMNLEWK